MNTKDTELAMIRSRCAVCGHSQYRAVERFEVLLWGAAFFPAGL